MRHLIANSFPLIGFSDLAVLVGADRSILCKIDVRQHSSVSILKRSPGKVKWQQKIIFPEAVITVSSNAPRGLECYRV